MNPYFDLEYDPRLNQDKTPDKVVDALLRLLNKFLNQHFGVSFSFEDVVELDSSRSGETQNSKLSILFATIRSFCSILLD